MPSRRALAAEQWAMIGRITAALGPDHLKRLTQFTARDVVIVTGMDRVDGVILQSPLIGGLRLAGFEPVVLSESGGSDWLEAAYRAFGVSRFVYYETLLRPGPHPETDSLMVNAQSVERFIEQTYRGTAIGKYALSTLMRRLRDGNPELGDPRVRAALRNTLEQALRYTDAISQLIDDLRPAGALILDRGYTPNGQLFDLCLDRADRCFTWNSAHRNGVLMLKRFHKGNRDRHPSTLSGDSWATMKSAPWSAQHWSRLDSEFERCYRSGEWFGGVGTQVDKRFPDPESLRSMLGLDPNKKTAVIFAHIFWDSTFFWGTDLFGNFEKWFKAVVKSACANRDLQWLIKIHPGNLVKDALDGYTGEHSEEVAIREVVGELPSHVRLLPAGFEVSTMSLREITDYCLTVRGTVGIEMSCYGIPVITAGTGRYDRLGFTVDPDTPQEYLDLVANLPELPPMTPRQTELARQFAYGLFIRRPTELTSIDFAYNKDRAASLAVSVNGDGNFDPAEADDLRAIADWIQSGAEDFLRSAD
ncbi:MAG: hypothetical protein O7H40_10435 [Gammaproteobacteria bacterium]|nr:hypothetical protein [Gammaproteobacteria bacterium]